MLSLLHGPIDYILIKIRFQESVFKDHIYRF